MFLFLRHFGKKLPNLLPQLVLLLFFEFGSDFETSPVEPETRKAAAESSQSFSLPVACGVLYCLNKAAFPCRAGFTVNI